MALGSRKKNWKIMFGFVQPKPKMFRAIRSFNGGKSVEFSHFNTLMEAYRWLLPSLIVQQEERWHIKLVWQVSTDMDELVQNKKWLSRVSVGYNEGNSQTFTYIQHVVDYNSTLPEL